MMMANNVKMALSSIRSAKWRSLLTMLGIIVGVLSVVTIVSLGEGVKREVVGQINKLGSDLITVRPGRTVTRDATGAVSNVNLIQNFAGGLSFTEADYKAIQRAKHVRLAVPISMVTGVASINEREYADGMIIGTTEGMPQVLNQRVEFGAFFDTNQEGKNIAVIGRDVAHKLFQENSPVGRAMSIRGQSFIVGGVFEQFDANPLNPAADYNTAIFIPFETAKRLVNGQPQVQQVLVKPANPDFTDSTATSIEASLRAEQGGKSDFTVLRQEDSLVIANRVINLLTGLISAIAAISLLVGGIGIMNIMLVSVSERTHEIGVRKAVGATNGQILGQFVTEAAMISFVGGLIGVICSLILNYALRVFTELQPVVTPQIVIVAVFVALVVGIFFGTTPALKAARKHPIDALRQY